MLRSGEPKDRWEVKACATCGYERRVRVRWDRWDGQGWTWTEECTACQKELAAWSAERAADNARKRAIEARRAQDQRIAERRQGTATLDRTVKEVIYHLRDEEAEYYGAILCGKRSKNIAEFAEDSNCEQCVKKYRLNDVDRGESGS